MKAKSNLIVEFQAKGNIKFVYSTHSQPILFSQCNL